MPLRPIDFLSTFFLSLCIPFTTYAQHDSLRISLDELFARGAEQHLQLHADRLKEQMAEERIRDARTARMPDISIGLKGGVLGQPVVWQNGLNDPTRPDTPDWQQNYTVDFTQPLYQGGKSNIPSAKPDWSRTSHGFRRQPTGQTSNWNCSSNI